MSWCVFAVVLSVATIAGGGGVLALLWLV